MNQITSLAANRRQDLRLAIHHHSKLMLTLDGSAGDADAIGGVTMTDISQGGLMASYAGQIHPGTAIILEIPLIGWREATVMWMADNRIGCHFVRPLDLDELRLAAANSDRLAEECPALVSQIAGIETWPTPVPPAATTIVEEFWPAMLITLLGLVLAGFALMSWLLQRAG